MDSFDILQAKSELLEGLWRETGNEQAISIASRWLKKWILELHVEHTFSRDIIEQYRNEVGYVEHTHKAMYFQIAEEIFKQGIAVMETEVNNDDGRPDPFKRQDRLTVYLMGCFK